MRVIAPKKSHKKILKKKVKKAKKVNKNTIVYKGTQGELVAQTQIKQTFKPIVHKLVDTSRSFSKEGLRTKSADFIFNLNETNILIEIKNYSAKLNVPTREIRKFRTNLYKLKDINIGIICNLGENSGLAKYTHTDISSTTINGNKNVLFYLPNDNMNCKLLSNALFLIPFFTTKSPKKIRNFAKKVNWRYPFNHKNIKNIFITKEKNDVIKKDYIKELDKYDCIYELESTTEKQEISINGVDFTIFIRSKIPKGYVNYCLKNYKCNEFIVFVDPKSTQPQWKYNKNHQIFIVSDHTQVISALKIMSYFINTRQ